MPDVALFPQGTTINCNVFNFLIGNDMSKAVAGMCDGPFVGVGGMSGLHGGRPQNMDQALKTMKKLGVGVHCNNRATRQLYIVPMVVGSSVEIKIKYSCGEEQCWTSSYGRNGDPKQYEFRANDDGAVVIVFVYADGDSQIKIFRRHQEQFTFYSKTGDTYLNVTPANKQTVRVDVGFACEYKSKDAGGNDLSLFLKGEKCSGKGNFADWIADGDTFSGMLMHENFNATIEQHCKNMLLNCVCNKI